MNSEQIVVQLINLIKTQSNQFDFRYLLEIAIKMDTETENIELIRILYKLYKEREEERKNKEGEYYYAPSSLFHLSDNIQIIKLLISLGETDYENIFFRPSSGRFSRIKPFNDELLCFFDYIPTSDYEKLLQQAVAYHNCYGYKNLILRLLEHVDINTIHKETGNSLLHIAVMGNYASGTRSEALYGPSEIIQQLLDAGIDTKIKNKDGDYAHEMTLNKEVRSLITKFSVA
jgi:ankyrin repeat protein